MSNKKGWFNPRNIYGYLITKILIAFVALTLTQVMYYLLNKGHFHIDGIGEWAGIVWGFMRYAMATVTLVLVPFIVINIIPTNIRWKNWYRSLSNILYIIPVLVVVVVNQIDVAYFQFTYRRMSSEMFAYMGVGGDMGNLIPQFLVDYWPVSVSGVAIITLLLLSSHKTIFPAFNEYGINRRNDYIGLGFTLLLTLFLVRGGAQRHFIELNDSARYCQMKNTPLVLNSPYNIIRTLGVPDLTELNYMSDDEALSLFNPQFIPLADSTNRTAAVSYGDFHAKSGKVSYLGNDSLTYYRGKNIVIIILESFSQEYMGCYNEDLELSFTPFLDSLAGKSLLFQGRSNGKKSIESIPSVMASMPTLMDKPVLLSEYKKNDIVGLPMLLKKHGYNTAFFHGAYNGSMGFDAFCKKIGFDAYYGRNEFGNEKYYDGTWGIYDEHFLQYMALQLTRTPEPFFAGVFTISSHHPYNIPDEYKGTFRTGKHPILECVNYSDMALRKFFATASAQPWYENTLFIIMADHPAQALSPQFSDYGPWYRIPMIIFDPQHPVAQRSNRIMQQSDVMPTLIDYLGYNEPCICFGTSVFQQPEGWQIAYGCGYHQLVTNDGVALIEETKSRTFEQDGNGKLMFLKAILQQYSQRMINNKLNRE
ncbi:MAG: sulfatase-like hydrolase/transferase [Bacteroidales bacterium]|nr:sulfatase-like hydrolase/transferase [Bacteroidales bacterium]